MRSHPEIGFWVSVGDLADERGRYAPVPVPLHFIKGNNENFDVLAGRALPPNLVYLPNAEAIELDRVRIAGLGGTHAPSWYACRARDLPHPVKSTAKATEAADKRRHFVGEEVDACKGLR